MFSLRSLKSAGSDKFDISRQSKLALSFKRCEMALLLAPVPNEAVKPLFFYIVIIR